MKTILIAVILLLSSGFLQAQSTPVLQVEKSVGQPLSIGWSFATTSETEIDSFVVENCSGINTGCTDAGPVVLKTLRTWTTTVTAAMASKPFFQVRSVKGTNRSEESNPVAVTIRIPPPASAFGQ